MAIRISVNTAYPKFASLDAASLKKVSVGLGPSGMNTVFFSYDSYPLNPSTMGDAGVNQASLMVSVRRPLVFSRAAFGVFGSVLVTDFASGRLAALLADYVRRGVLKVTDTTAGELTADDVLTFTP